MEVKYADPAPSGSLEELFTDFDNWITKRSWKFRQRPPFNQPIPERNLQEKVPCRNHAIEYQDCLVNGFDINKHTYPIDNSLLRISKHGDQLVYLDFALVRLIRENGRRRMFSMSRSKL